jgi:hypothetical protein
MAAEMPTRVDPAPGASQVEFPWEAASAAVAALNAAESMLGSQLGERPAMIETIVDWEGRYRDQFDRKDTQIREQDGPPLREDLARLASSIVSEAESTNEEQRNNNLIAEQEPDGLVSPRAGVR